MRSTLTMVFVVLSIYAPQVGANGPSAASERPDSIDPAQVEGLSAWLKARFSDTELAHLLSKGLRLEAHYCGCYDKPAPHFPYAVVLLDTPKGTLVARPEQRESALAFTPLAVKFGNEYCELDSAEGCYGSFAHPCEFTDARYGPYLEPFFPTCKAGDEEAEMPRSEGQAR